MENKGEKMSDAYRVISKWAKWKKEQANLVDCQICGEVTSMIGTKLCDNCWEITKRIDNFLESENGKKYIRNKLQQGGKNE